YITYEYTRDDAGAQEPAFRCPDGASRQCGGDSVCVAANGGSVEPVFDSYPGVTVDAMRISEFRAGPLCGESVCEQSADIRVGGQDVCGGNRCTRFGMEFDYRNADPSKPLECSVSTSGGEEDFIGSLLKLGADAHQTRTQEESKPAGQEDGMAQLLGMFSKVIASADSPEDLQISMAPLDENGKPIESQRVGSAAASADPPIPRSVDLPSASGHLFVPMYQVADQSVSGDGKERLVRCTHNGAPVLETTFRLRAY
ncbi:MAG: hypothetical protein KDI31_12150, partial [Pseudomonadales bacterium]|nr:hypothetical protein [Pseudomonadales bacterium]